MPKIIKDAELMIVNEAKKQIMENGYSAVTVRSIALGCHIAVGTIYNYYPSKDMIVARFMLEDWMVSLEKMQRLAPQAAGGEELLRTVYECLKEYKDRYAALFTDERASESSAAEYDSRHVLLRGQLSSVLEEPCRKFCPAYTDFIPVFLAECMLSWSAPTDHFEQLYAVLKHLFAI